MSLFETRSEAVLKVLAGLGYVAAGAGVVVAGVAAYNYATAGDRTADELDRRLAQRLEAERAEAAARKALAGAEAAAGVFGRMLEAAPEADKKALAPLARLLGGEVDAAKNNAEEKASALDAANQRLLVRIAPGMLFART